MKTTLTFIIILLAIPLSAFSQTSGENLFDKSYVHEIRFTSYIDEFEGIMEAEYILSYNMLKQQIRNIPYIKVGIEIDGFTIDTVGVRYKGYNSWWSSIKKPLKVDINEFTPGQKYDGLKKFNLHNGAGDPTLMRENLCYKLMNQMNVYAPRTAYAKVYIDEEYKGLYSIVEQIDKVYLDVRFGNHSGNLYKQDNPGSGGYVLTWEGNSQDSYYPYLELKTNKSENDWSTLIHFIDVLNNSSSADFKSSISELFAVEEYLQTLAFDIAVYNVDFYGGAGRNYYLYHDSDGDNKIHWLPWDYNLTWRADPPNLKVFEDEYPVLIKRILEVQEFKDFFIERYCFVKEYMNREYIDPVLAADSTTISPLLENDEYLNYPISAFRQNISSTHNKLPGIKEFIDLRNPELLTVLENLNIDCNSVISNVSDEHQGNSDYQVELYPNPANEYVYISTESEISKISITNIFGQTIYNNATVSKKHLNIDLSSYPSGCYYICFEIDGSRIVEKLAISR